jgi:RimJ/RimL family protein N-acetyltransferase
MVELTKKERMNAIDLCKGYEEEVTLYACIRGYMGRIWADNREQPQCAMIVIADFCYIVGSYQQEQTPDMLQLLGEHVKNKVIICNPKEWQPLLDLIKKHYPDSFKSFLRYALIGEKDWFDQDKLRRWAAAIEPEFKVVRIDETIYPITRQQFWTMDFCSNFETVEAFYQYGIGYVVMKDDEIISGASSYSYDGERLEITIETKEEYRKKGLALACAAKLILESLSKGIFPRWDAANLTSVALAEKLGYRFSHEYTVYTF